jgi:hypothetical protein
LSLNGFHFLVNLLPGLYKVGADSSNDRGG